MTARRRRATPYTMTRAEVEELRARPPAADQGVAWACDVALGEQDGPVTPPCLQGCLQRCCDAINRPGGAP